MALAITVPLNRVRQTWTGHCGSAPAVPFRQSPFPGRLDTGPSTVRVPRIRRRGVGPFPWHLRGTLATYCATVEIPAKQVVKARIAKQLRDVLEA